MGKKQFVFTGFVLFMVTSFFVTGCIGFGGVRVGDLQTRSQTVELDDADAVDVEIRMGAGELDVSGGASELLDATFTYNVEDLNPQATYEDSRLEVSDSDVDEGIASLFDLDEFRNEWELNLNDDVPMEMEIDLGAGPSTLALGSLALTRLNIQGGAGNVDLDLSGSQSLSRLDLDAGAGEVTVDLTGEWRNDLDARVNGGLGNITVRLPGDVGVAVDVQSGVGSVDANNLNRDGDTYTNDAYGESNVTLRIAISGGVGQINLEVE